MCGIFAWVAAPAPLAPPAFDAAVRTVAHRGPEGIGMWTDPARLAGLGHTRLAFQDLEHGQQPMANEDRTAHVVVNGELYGFSSIGASLVRRGHRLATCCDSEIVLHLYEDHGVRCLEHLRGEFAFALWDARTRRLFAARDRFGIKPLYWSLRDGRLMLASEAKAILAAGVPAEWDRASYLRTLFLCQPSTSTLFAGIHQVPPGHYLLHDDTGTRLARYWDLDYPGDPGDPEAGGDAAERHAPEARERLHAGLREAIALRLQADVPIGLFLSGGIDSSTVGGIAARAQSAPLQSFTVSFPDQAFDEGPVARRTAAHLATRHVEVGVTHDDLASHWDDAVWHGETLAANAHGVARYLQARMVRAAGCKAVLAGEGADEVMAGYSFSRHDWDGQRKDDGDGRAIPPGLGAVAARLGFVPGWMRNVCAERVLLHALLTPEMAAEADRLDPYGALVEECDADDQLRGRHAVVQSLVLWSRSVLPGYILFADRMEMAHGVESRLPYLDHVLFDELRAWPASLLMRGPVSKHLLREVARDYVTPEVAARHKQPFAAPALATGDAPCRAEMRARIRAGLDEQDFFAAPAVRSLLTRLDRMDDGADTPFEPLLLLMASTFALQARYRISSWRH